MPVKNRHEFTRIKSRIATNKKYSKNTSGRIRLKFDEKGLIPAVIQDYKTGEVLMVAYMNRQSLKKTLATKKTHFWSRSRKKLWLKGETSGNFQKVKEIYYDCDADCLLFKVRQKGVACHTGNYSCFYRRLRLPLTVYRLPNTVSGKQRRAKRGAGKR